MGRMNAFRVIERLEKLNILGGVLIGYFSIGNKMIISIEENFLILRND